MLQIASVCPYITDTKLPCTDEKSILYVLATYTFPVVRMGTDIKPYNKNTKFKKRLKVVPSGVDVNIQTVSWAGIKLLPGKMKRCLNDKFRIDPHVD